jgi:hypothetical protein
MGVDAQGNPVIDPTANVLQLVEAAMQRSDDLRLAATKRSDDLREAGEMHVREVADLRANFERELREAEAARIDAIRAVDVGAVNRAAEVQAAAATTLAAQVVASAEAMRNQVAATASAGTIALNAALDPIQKAIDDLRRAQYEAQGQKTQVVESRTNIGQVWGAVVAVAGIVVGAYIGTHR